MTDSITKEARLTIGIDLGDRYSQVCILDDEGEVMEEGRLRTTPEAMLQRFSVMPKSRIAIEVGTHSAWVSRILQKQGHETLVANPRKLRLIYQNPTKSDEVDAGYLARIARLDPKLLAPIQHRGKDVQEDLSVLRSRDLLVQTRTKLINHVRGTVKSLGCRIPSITSGAFGKKAADAIPRELKPALDPVIQAIQSLTEHIRHYDRQII